MARDTPWPNRSADELAKAHRALAYALAALDDPKEFCRRSQGIPDWLFREDPERAERAAELLPILLDSLRALAQGGHEEATEKLFQLLEQHPHLRMLLPSSK